jgi:hypothetical protein
MYIVFCICPTSLPSVFLQRRFKCVQVLTSMNVYKRVLSFYAIFEFE